MALTIGPATSCGEERHEESEIAEAVGVRETSAIDVDRVAERLERVEGDPHRDDLGPPTSLSHDRRPGEVHELHVDPGPREQRVDHGAQPVAVLEEAQQAQVPGQGEQ